MTVLAHPAEIKTLVYMAAATLIPVIHWRLDAPSVILIAASIIMAFAVSAMHHNHAHHSIWRLPLLNRLTDDWFALLQGHPGFVFEPMHVDNHHRHHNGPDDITRTWKRGDSNNLWGLLKHPIDFVATALAPITRYAFGLYINDKKAFHGMVRQYLLIFTLDGALIALNGYKALYCVVLPQAAALFFLLASNYLQHAHTDGASDFNHSRNFTGLINVLFFNVGYHTAHHHDVSKHWSELPALHEAIAPAISPTLNEKSFCWYCLRVFVLGAVCRRFRSAAIMPARGHGHDIGWSNHAAR